MELNPKRHGRKVSHMPSMAGDGANVLDLSMDSQNNTECNIADKAKKGRTQRSQNKKQATKIDSDLKIVAEMSSDSECQKFEKTKNSKQIESDLELQLHLKTKVESSKDDLVSDLDKHRVLLIENGSEKKRVNAITKKLQKANRRGKAHKKEVREQKENDIPVVAKGVPTPKGKPGKSVCILDKQIKENKQALLDLLEQARKCVETSESSHDSEMEMPTCKLNEKKKRLSTKMCLKQTINKVHSKLDKE